MYAPTPTESTVTMGITVSFDPSDADDLAFIGNLIENAGVIAAEEAPAPKAAPKSRAKKAAPEPEPEEDEGPTLEDAVARAQELVGEGRAAEVKGALANLGVKKVSELEESQYGEFIEALSEESVV